jgi:hypothetical protein
MDELDPASLAFPISPVLRSTFFAMTSPRTCVRAYNDWMVEECS